MAAVMFASTGVDPSPQDWQQAARGVLPPDLEDDTKAAFVVDHPDGGGRLIASAAGSTTQWFPTVFNATGRSGYVQWVATDPEFRRRGHSLAVMTALLDWFRSRDVTLVDLQATPQAEPLYRSLVSPRPTRCRSGCGSEATPHLTGRTPCLRHVVVGDTSWMSCPTARRLKGLGYERISPLPCVTSYFPLVWLTKGSKPFLSLRIPVREDRSAA